MNASAIQLRRREVPAYGPWPPQTHPVVQRVLAARGVTSADAAQLSLRRLLDPQTLGGLDRAVDLVVQALRGQWRICVVGDFDCDGATGTAVAVRGLRLLGARQVEYRVPHRMRHGYGLSPALVAEFETPRPQLLITVDNGISSLAGVQAAKAAGMTVLITDHHLPGPQLPEADAIVNPNLQADPFPSKALAGVGVMFYLLLAVRARMRTEGGFVGGEPDLASLLDLVALGTVADLVPLDHNNRILVAAGLARMRRGECCAGIRALCEVSGRALAQLGSTDLGFALGPRINAAGRLEDMSVGIACLLEDSPLRALELARQLQAINAERRDLQELMVSEAEGEGSLVVVEGAPAAHGLCLFDPAWHAGVVGLVASRIKEQRHRPVVAFAPASDAEHEASLRGSARSIPGFHVRDALAAIDAAEPGLIERFGGHAMAAGLSLPRAHLPRFATAFERIARAALDEDLLQQVLWSDGALQGGDFSRDLADQLRGAGPWGQAFPEPVFDGVFAVRDWRPVGTRHLKLRLQCVESGTQIDGIHFGGWDGQPPEPQLRLLYQLEPDDYRDRGGVQLLIRHRFAA